MGASADAMDQASTQAVEEAEPDEDESAPEPVHDPFVCPEHGEVHPEDRPWLPKQERGDLAPHPYCPDCGEVKALGMNAGLDKGGLVNLIADLERLMEREGHIVTDVQKRLILKRLEEENVDDAYGFTKSRQLAIVADIASDYLGVPETVMMSYLRAC